MLVYGIPVQVAVIDVLKIDALVPWENTSRGSGAGKPETFLLNRVAIGDPLLPAHRIATVLAHW